MNITEVRVSPSKGGKVLAFASIVIDDCFVVNDLRIQQSKNGQIYVTMPGRRLRSGQFRDIAHPLDSRTRKVVEDRVIDAFEESLANAAIPDRRAGKSGGGVLDELASRLFNEDFWVEEEDGSPSD